jgi:hypothetical protein
MNEDLLAERNRIDRAGGSIERKLAAFEAYLADLGLAEAGERLINTLERGRAPDWNNTFAATAKTRRAEPARAAAPRTGAQRQTSARPRPAPIPKPSRKDAP